MCRGGGGGGLEGQGLDGEGSDRDSQITGYSLGGGKVVVEGRDLGNDSSDS